MMDAAGLVLPAAVAGGGSGVTVMEVESRESEHISIVVVPKIDRCSSTLGQRDEVDAINPHESIRMNKMPSTELCGSGDQLSSFHCKDATGELKFASTNCSPLSMPSLEGKQIRRRSGKMAGSSSGCAKRSRVAQMEDASMNDAEANDVMEKPQVAKQKNGLNGKRGDRRNGKVSMKSKYDYFSLKAGMVSFNSGGGGSNSLGIYGLKPDIYDVTKHLDELSVKELLDGGYKGPSFFKDKGKKISNLNDNILNSVRKACSILQQQKPMKTQNFTESDNSYNRKVSACPVSFDTSTASRNDNDKGDTCITDMPSHDKVPAKVLDFILYQPKDILERLALPPPVNLDALLTDAAKPTFSSKDNLDSRGKQISHRPSLPPLPWSHNSVGHCKSNVDANKLCTSRSTCQGKWVKIESTATSLDGRTNFLAELECLNYDPELVPVVSMQCLPSANHVFQCTSVTFPFLEFGASSATCSKASQLPSESGGSLKCEEDAGNSPRSLAAAQTLYDIATHSLKQELHQWIRLSNKSSEKTMKACKSKSTNKFKETFTAPKSVTTFHNQVKNPSTLKKPRLLINEKSKELATTSSKVPTNWSMPRSSTQSLSRSFRDSFAEAKSYNANVVKQSFMMPPPSSRIFDKACNGRQRLR